MPERPAPGGHGEPDDQARRHQQPHPDGPCFENRHHNLAGQPGPEGRHPHGDQRELRGDQGHRRERPRTAPGQRPRQQREDQREDQQRQAPELRGTTDGLPRVRGRQEIEEVVLE